MTLHTKNFKKYTQNENYSKKKKKRKIRIIVTIRVGHVSDTNTGSYLNFLCYE